MSPRFSNNVSHISQTPKLIWFRFSAHILQLFVRSHRHSHWNQTRIRVHSLPPCPPHLFGEIYGMLNDLLVQHWILRPPVHNDQNCLWPSVVVRYRFDCISYNLLTWFCIKPNTIQMELDSIAAFLPTLTFYLRCIPYLSAFAQTWLLCLLTLWWTPPIISAPWKWISIDIHARCMKPSA